MELSTENLSLLGCLLLCGYLSYLCCTPPHPPKVSQKEGDRLQSKFMTGVFGINFLSYTAIFAYHIILILFPRYQSIICRHPNHLNNWLTTWSSNTTIFVIAILIFAPIRLLSYAQLGNNFTFVLAKPNKLITTGVYHYVQHPSYTGLIPVLGAWYWFYTRLDGIAVCILPPEIVGAGVFTFIPPLGLSLLTLWGILLRIRDEEEMMKRSFGMEWVKWHRKTKRFIPGVF
jgi:protein-S-isoprenylcysteine O-methyltransferase Ste14